MDPVENLKMKYKEKERKLKDLEHLSDQLTSQEQENNYIKGLEEEIDDLREHNEELNQKCREYKKELKKLRKQLKENN